MKKNLLFCFVVLCAVLFTGCKDKDDDPIVVPPVNPAEKYVGTYDLVATPNVTMEVPYMGTMELPASPYNVTCTIALDGNEGRVIATSTLSADTMHGLAAQVGLQFEPVTTTLEYTLDAVGDIVYNGVLTFPLISFPDGVHATWESTINGNVSLSIMGQPLSVPANGTVSFTATKQTGSQPQ